LETLEHKAAGHIRDILAFAIEHSDHHQALVVFDERSELSALLAAAYRRCLPKARFVDFDAGTPEDVLEAFTHLNPADLVVLVQSTNFRLETFRIRVELFKRGMKVIEHPHLGRMTGAESARYVDALAYDPDYYRGVGHRLRARLDQAVRAVVDSGGERLVFSSSFESSKLNVGDYREMKNIGGQFPIGEVFTEAKDPTCVNGAVRIFAFADLLFRVNQPLTPITLTIEKGRVVGTANSTPDFEAVLESIKADEGQVWIRELGFGMNRAFTKERTVSDVGTYERVCGVHLSMGAKHAVYQKPGFHRRDGRHHVDVFVAVESVVVDDVNIFENGQWTA
jgi:hypothetical protein